MRALILTAVSVFMTTIVVGNAYIQKKQFYPAVVYLTKSNPSMAILYVQAFVLVVLMGKLCRKIFFGALRAAETEHLIERSWYAVTETCLAFTVFRDDFSPKFVALFVLLLLVKSFHWLGEDRVDYMERSPMITWLFHLRANALLFCLMYIDLIFINHAYHSTMMKGASAQLVFGFEYAILFTVLVTIEVKYILHCVDLRLETPWEDKAVCLLFTELIMGFIKVVLYAAFMVIMIRIHTFPLFAIRPMYLSVRAFRKAVYDVIMSRRAIRNMNTLYPDATAEELASVDNVCIICRDEMLAATTGKKLPCNHIFHASCLRSWFQRQQTCPTCRMDVLNASARPEPAAPAAPAEDPPAALQAEDPQADENVPLPNRREPVLPNRREPVDPDAPPPPGMENNWFRGRPTVFINAADLPTMRVEFEYDANRPGDEEFFRNAAGAQQDSNTARQGQDGASTSAGTSTDASSSQWTPPRAWTPNPHPVAPMPIVPPYIFGPGVFPGLPNLHPPMPPSDLTGLTDEEIQAMAGTSNQHIEASVECLQSIQLLLNLAVTQLSQYISIVNSQMQLNQQMTAANLATQSRLSQENAGKRDAGQKDDPSVPDQQAGGSGLNGPSDDMEKPDVANES